MTPREKWDRIHKATCREDYQLSMTVAELETFPEGREYLISAGLLPFVTTTIHAQYVEQAADAIARDIDEVILSALKGGEKADP